MMGLSGKAAAVGVAGSDATGILPDKSTLQLVAEALLNALDDAGLSVAMIELGDGARLMTNLDEVEPPSTTEKIGMQIDKVADIVLLAKFRTR
jgi:hypothetical protein